MNGKYLATLSAIALITTLNLPITQAQTPQLVTTFTLNNVLVKDSLVSQNQTRESVEPTPVDRGAPRDRKGAGSYAT